MRKWVFFIESEEVCICPECGGLLKYRDKVLRGQKQTGGERKMYMINRLKCTNESCGKLHRQLTDGMIKYKQYSAEVIEDVLDEVISEEDGLEYPCEGTMERWRRWFHYNKVQMEGQMRSAGYRLLDSGSGFLKSQDSLLGEIRKRISPGWLGMVCRIVNNSGGMLRVLPESRFCTDFYSLSVS